MKPPITTAVIGMNGYSTRRLPVTAAIPKDFMPIGNRPAVDFVIDDLVAAGITDIYCVVHPHFESIYTTYFQGYPELDMQLRANGRTEQLAELKRLRKRARFHLIPFSPDPKRYGTAIPLIAALEIIGNKPCVYMGSDDFTIRADGGSNMAELIKLFGESDAPAALLGKDFPTQELHSMGVLQVEEQDGQLILKGVVEKPEHPERLPEPRLANISRYALGESFFPYLERIQPNPKNGEYYIIEGFDELVRDHTVAVGKAKGDYYEVGSLKNWLYANEKLAQE